MSRIPVFSKTLIILCMLASCDAQQEPGINSAPSDQTQDTIISESLSLEIAREETRADRDARKQDQLREDNDDNQASTVDSTEIATDDIHVTFSDYQQKTASSAAVSCNAIESFIFDNSIAMLNSVSEQMFAADDITAVNSYANLVALSQLALLAAENTNSVIDNYGLTTITSNEQLSDVFCHIEQSHKTNNLSVDLINDWHIQDNLLSTLSQTYNADFYTKDIGIDIEPEDNFERLALSNAWAINSSGVVGQDSDKFVEYQQYDDSANDVSSQVAKTIQVTENVVSASNHYGDLFTFPLDNDTTVSIVMPTFQQYNFTKDNIATVLSSLKAEQAVGMSELYIPYFGNEVNADNFMTLTKWLPSELFDNSAQDFSGINTIEDFILLINHNDSDNGFEFNQYGELNAFTDISVKVEATEFVIEAFPVLYAEFLAAEAANYGSYSQFSSVDFTQVLDYWYGGNFNLSEIGFCNEPLPTEAVWRPYFIILENAHNGLLYSIAANETPEFEAQPDNLCVELL